MASKAPRFWRVLVIGATAAVALGAVNAESVGPYAIEATPISAVLVSGGGASFNWLHVIDTPVSIDQAFTGFSVVDDGYANAQSGTTLRMTFASGTLRNGPGPDLVLLDAGNDLNVYLVSTSHDGFAQQIVSIASSDTGVDRSYYLGGQGPTTSDILAATIDLSSLGVPEGQAVDHVRLFSEGPANDPLGLGVLSRPGRVPPTVLVGKSLVTPDAIVLDWSPTCSAGAEDYAIYEGTLGVWYDHEAIDCWDDARDTVEEIVPDRGDRYFLVVPRNPGREGSYGLTSADEERPIGIVTCAPAQDTSACP